MSGTGISAMNVVPNGGNLAGGSVNALGSSYMAAPNTMGGNQSLFESKAGGAPAAMQKGGYVPQNQNKWFKAKKSKRRSAKKSARDNKKKWLKSASASYTGGKRMRRRTHSRR